MTIGAMAGAAIEGSRAAIARCDSPLRVTVIDPRWAYPIDPVLADYLSHIDGVVTVEDGLINGGVGAEIGLELERLGVVIPMEKLGIDRRFVAQGRRDAILEAEHMSASDVDAGIIRVASLACRNTREGIETR